MEDRQTQTCRQRDSGTVGQLGQLVQWDRQTHSGIIIKSNLVSFKCDLYAESVCPFFPKTQKKRKNWKSNPIPSNSVQSRRPASEGGNRKRNNFEKSRKQKGISFFFFFFDWNQFKLFSRKAARQKASTGLVERIWSRLQSVSIRYICVSVCAHNRYGWRINPFEYPSKYSHAYAQICWQLFRWISINPRVIGKPMWEHRSGIFRLMFPCVGVVTQSRTGGMEWILTYRWVCQTLIS